MLKYSSIISITLFCFVIIKAKHFTARNRSSNGDLPQKNDLEVFFKPIENLTRFISSNLTYMNINFALGTFFTNVHLSRALLDGNGKISPQMITRMEAVVDTNERSLNYFLSKAKKVKDFISRDDAIISYLFNNSTYWVYRLKNMNYEKQGTSTKKDLEKIYTDWETYVKKVNNVYKWQPNPTNSDICLVSVSINPKNMANSSYSWCPVADLCYDLLKEGSNFGYALGHRIFFLLMAHLGRGCAILGISEDEAFLKKFCQMAYVETEYIALNNYGIPDLMLEMICLCATDGRVQFLRRKWLKNILDFQKPTGCFDAMGINKTINSPFGCNSHTIALASGTYAAAVRYIITKVL